ADRRGGRVMAPRRACIKWAAAGGVGLAVAGRGILGGPARAAPAAPTAPAATPVLTPYLDQMPILVDNLIDATGGQPVNLSTELISRQVHSQLPATTLFGYVQSPSPAAPTESYLGPVIVAKYKVPVAANYTNNLQPNDFQKVFTNGGSSYMQFNEVGGVRILTHLHGAIDSGDSDGNPFANKDAFAYQTTQS